MGQITHRKPQWLKYKIPSGPNYTKIKKIINERNLNTVCVEAGCPNIGECFACGTATFLIMGTICTRNCKYCSIKQGKPEVLDNKEPDKISEAVKRMSLNYSVLTSVTRDDLYDGGASIFAETVKKINNINPNCKIELLVPDFKNSMDVSIQKIIESGPDIINHNIEVVRKYFKELRPMGSYSASLNLIELIARSGIPAKSGLMIGFGESYHDIKNTLVDLYNSGCTIVTIGQYLQSSKNGFSVSKFYHPEEFNEIETTAKNIGFKNVMAGPLVRSSYHASTLTR